jgi:hypothetical protein
LRGSSAAPVPLHQHAEVPAVAAMASKRADRLHKCLPHQHAVAASLGARDVASDPCKTHKQN